MEKFGNPWFRVYYDGIHSVKFISSVVTVIRLGLYYTAQPWL